MIMPPEHATHSILFLTGEVHALLNCLQAIVRVSPDRGKLMAEIETVAQFGLSNLEQLPHAGDVAIEGYQFAIGSIRKAVEAA